MTTIRETIERDLGDEPQSVVKVYETAKLRTDFREYVLTDALTREFSNVLEPVVESARPATSGTNNVGIWVSGFFGSGKSHFSKIVGHLIANTPIGKDTARSLFREHLRHDRPDDEQVASLLQEADNYGLVSAIVPFDIAASYSPADGTNVGRTFLRVLYEAAGLSPVIPFAERELELRQAGLYDEFTELYEERSGVPWGEDKKLAASSSTLAPCLAQLLPERYASAELALESLKFELEYLNSLNITDVVTRLVRWLDAEQAGRKETLRLIFVADEVGAWTGRDLGRIEQVRSLVEQIGVVAQGRIWLLATSQERLSDVAANAPGQDPAQAKELQHRLEARFRVNVHLESSEVGTVIENRVLKKKPAARPELEKLWRDHQAQLAGIANPPALELGGNYPTVELERFVSDYPFLPYQMPVAADLFGVMRGPKVSSGARSMIKVVFDAVQHLADDDMGRLVSWDQVFNSANRDNEFADEQYLGTQGLNYLANADRDVAGTPITSSRVLKVLWLIQQSSRIPRTVPTLARLLVGNVNDDILEVEKDLKETLAALEEKNYVRLETATEQWRFLTQDQVTVERIVQRIAEEDIKQKDLRDEVFKLQSERLQQMFNGRITHGRSNTVFDYSLGIGDTALKNDDAAVKLKLLRSGDATTATVVSDTQTQLDLPIVAWVVDEPTKLGDRLRRALAIHRLPADAEFRRVATDRTKAEAKELEGEADRLLADASKDVQTALERGTLYYGGRNVPLGARSKNGAQVTPRAAVEEALRDRIDAAYTKFVEGDRAFTAGNIDKVFTVAPAERAALDPDLGFFTPEGQGRVNQPVLEALLKHLLGTTKNAGGQIAEHFGGLPFGWAPDLIRYAAATLFVEGRISVVEPSGKAHDDYRQAAARALFGTAAFKKAKFDVEEEPLTPEERKAARDLLTELGVPPTNDGELALKEATLKAAGKLAEATADVRRAEEAEMPLPAVFDGIEMLRDELQGEGSRSKLIRSVLEHADELRSLNAAIGALGSFVQHHGLAQYRRSQELISLAYQAGLDQDPDVGDTVREAAEQYEAIKEQRRVLDDWDGPFSDYRAKVVEAYRGIYAPLFEEVTGQVAEARTAIESMHEYEELTTTNRSSVRAEFLTEGRPLAELKVPELRDEEQLVASSRAYSIPLLRSVKAALDAQRNLARTRVLQLYAEQRPGDEPLPVYWDPVDALSGAQFTTEEDVDVAFDAVKEDVKDIVRSGKVVRIL
jgi:hypothetical protein